MNSMFIIKKEMGMKGHYLWPRVGVGSKVGGSKMSHGCTLSSGTHNE